MSFDLTITLAQGAFTLDVGVRTEAQALALFGPSGSGKTTIVEAIAGLRQPARGKIVVDGVAFHDSGQGIDLRPRERRVGYVPQDMLLFPHLDVRRNLTYGQRADSGALAQVSELLEVDTLLNRGIASLSGGERQRVALGRALLSGPRVLLLDEPMAAVDMRRRHRIASALTRIRREMGIPIVYVTHAPDEVAAIADHVLVLESGRVAASGAPDDVLTRSM